MSEPKILSESVLFRVVKCLATLALHLFCLVLVVAAEVKIVPAFTMFFDRTNAELPVVSQQVIAVSEFVVSYWYLFFALFAVIDVPIVILLSAFGARTRWVLFFYNQFWLIAVILLFFWTMIGLGMPIAKFGMEIQ